MNHDHSRSTKYRNPGVGSQSPEISDCNALRLGNDASRVVADRCQPYAAPVGRFQGFGAYPRRLSAASLGSRPFSGPRKFRLRQCQFFICPRQRALHAASRHSSVLAVVFPRFPCR
jgi:hypothetical protein